MRRAATDAALELMMEQWAEQAEQGVRELVHRTRPATSELTDPVEAAQIIAVLAATTAMLPQLFDQLTGWLETQQRHGRLRADDLTAAPDAGQAVHAIAGALEHAGQCARQAAHALEVAHQHAAHLATTESTERRDNGRQRAGWSV